jgi:glycosyltransferase involved in cell wall biosynthesis
MKVSAVIPTYNRLKYIRRAIESVFAQTVAVDEVVIVDDGSSDGTAEAVEEWYGDRVRVVKQKNSGVSGARRRGIQEARGEWVAFLDSDDEWMPDRNRQLLEASAKVPADVAWIFGDMRVVSDAGEGATTLYQEYGLCFDESPKVFADSLTAQYPNQYGMLQASFIKRSALVELNCFGEGLRSDDDILTGYQIACKYQLAAIPAVVGKLYRTSDLAPTSVFVNGVYGPDHFRARMLAFSLVIESGRRHPWNKRYAAEVRFLCQVLADRGPVSRKLAVQQFKFGGFSAKGLAFFGAAMFGRTGIRVWNASTRFLRRHSQTEEKRQWFLHSAAD